MKQNNPNHNPRTQDAEPICDSRWLRRLSCERITLCTQWDDRAAHTLTMGFQLKKDTNGKAAVFNKKVCVTADSSY